MSTVYATAGEAQRALRLTGDANSSTLEDLVEVASRRIDYVTNRSFGPPVQRTVYYRCGQADDRTSEAVIHDLQPSPAPTLATATTEFADDDEWQPVEAGKYRLIADGERPATMISLAGRHEWLRVTGSFGWVAVPADIKRACLLLVSRLHQREVSPLGTIASGGELGDQPVQRYDPDFVALIQSYRRRAIS